MRHHRGAVSAAELARRWALVRAHLHGHGAQALVATASQDFLGGTYRWLTDRPAYHGYGATVIVYADGPMTIVDHGELEGLRRFDSHEEYPGVGTVRSTASFASAAQTHHYEAALICADLRHHGVTRLAVAGFGAMPHSMACMLQESGCALLDVTDWLDGVKAIKSTEELALIRGTAALQDEIFAHLLPQLRPGMVERDVMAIVQTEATRRGSDQGVIITGAASLGEPAVMRFPYYQQRRIEAGDSLSVLIEVSGPSGFYCELGRMVSFGPAPAALEDAMAQSLSMQAAVLAAARPGAAARDLAALHDDNLAARRLPPERRLFAHGQGYDLVERPLLRADETMDLAAGMNLACHPGIARRDLFCFVCDNHIVTETGTTPIHSTAARVFSL